MRPALVLACLLLAGCAGRGPAAPEAPAPPHAPLVLYLTEEGFTAAEPEADEPARVASGNFFRAWLAGEGLPTWRGSPPAADLVVENATVVVWAEAPRGAAQAGRFPSYIAYLGPQSFLMAQASLPPLGVVAPGDVRELVFHLGLPAGGLVLPAGEPIELLVSPVQTNDDAADRIDFLVGARAFPSRVELVARPAQLPAPDPDPSVSRAEGILAGSAYALGTAGPTTHETLLDLEGNVTRVDVRLEVLEHAGIPDVDFTVRNASGEAVASSVTPYGVEAVRLLPPNLAHAPRGEGTDLTVEVTNYGSVAVRYRLTVEIHEG